MKFYDVQQATEDWIKLRLGIPTASDFDKIMTPKTMKLSGSCNKLIARLIGEKLSPFLPERAETYTSRAMQWGQQTEEEARRFYTHDTGNAVTNGGFITTDEGDLGASPDGMVGEDGMLELKCPDAGTHVEWLLEGGLPDEYKPQVHGQLIVAMKGPNAKKYVDFLSYSPGLDPLLVRVEPNAYTMQLAEMIYGEFLPKYRATLKRITG